MILNSSHTFGEKDIRAVFEVVMRACEEKMYPCLFLLALLTNGSGE